MFLLALAEGGVLVLDLEGCKDSDERIKFVETHVSNLEIKNPRPEIIRTTLRSPRKNRMSAIKRARSEAADRGFNVVDDCEPRFALLSQLVAHLELHGLTPKTWFCESRQTACTARSPSEGCSKRHRRR